MFDTVILLTGAAEHSVFTTVLRGHNPDLTIIPVFTAEDLAAIEPAWLQRARLISFTTTVIVPAEILDQLGFGAYNFHPGPPQYPGWAPAHFALYDEAKEFGGTAHRMIRRVDAGPIIDLEMFEIPAGISVSGLEELAYTKLVQMFWRLAGKLATQSEPLVERAVRWSTKQSSQRAYRELCDIPLTIPKDELQRRLKVFGADHHGIAPTVRLHGYPFRVVVSDGEAIEA
jgi:methionyl-tRNA formyltransferase